MKRITLILIALMSLTTATMAKKPLSVTLQLLETSDVHGVFFPYNFVERRPMAGSMARVSTYVRQQRQKYGDNVILLENGDILQGQPTCYFTNFIDVDEKNIAAEVVNYMKYDAQTFGNHDVETGHPVYDKWISEVQCPTLGANIIDTKTGKPYVKPYIILERNGVRVAVLGMLTPAIPNWLPVGLWTGLHFQEMVSCARQYVKILKEQEHANVIVGLFHSGWDGGIVTPEYEEDATKRIAEEVDGFDVIFFGHDHRERMEQTANGTLCLDPSNNAIKVAQATLTLTYYGKKKGWHLDKKEGAIVDIRDQQIDPDYMAHFKTQTDRVQQFVERQIGTFTCDMNSRDAFFGSSSFTDYIHQLQLEETHADVSFNAPLVFDTKIKAGPVYMSDMFKLYRYENSIYVLRMTGAEIRRHLEMSYDLWVNTMKSADDHIMQLSAQTNIDTQRMGFKNLTFNFDSAAGIDYEVDVTKPDGQKVHILQFSNGRPFDEKAWYRVAMNSYRGNGGGELLTRGAGIPHDSIQSRIEYMSQYDQRRYLTQKIEREKTITPKALNNWRFVPEEWAKPALERDRKLVFKE